MAIQYQQPQQQQKRAREEEVDYFSVERPARDEKRTKVCYDNTGALQHQQQWMSSGVMGGGEDMRMIGSENQAGGGDVDMEMDVEDDFLEDPNSDWIAPRMIHQVSTTSLSSSASASSSSPPTPSDQFSSFTDSNGVTHQFLHNSPPGPKTPLSVYPPKMAAEDLMLPEEDPTAFASYVWGNTQMGTIEIKGREGDGMVRQLQLPVYGWDQPRQSNNLNGHLV